MTLAELLEARRRTKLLADLLHAEVESYLRVLAVVCRPVRVFGDFVVGGAKGQNPPGAERTFTELKARVAGANSTFGLTRELERPVALSGDKLELHPWETDCPLAGGRTLSVRAPFKWIVTYKCHYTPARVVDVLRGAEERNVQALEEFVVHACALALVIGKLPDLHTLFEGLRFRLDVETLPQLGPLPLVTIDSPIASMRPAETLMIEAAELAGGRTFEEVVDPARSVEPDDPLRRRIAEVLGGKTGG